ncbi:RHOMBOID-like protein 2 [Nicotiana tomentosiformis]|uniref:RHOMBOID-like protein 2 n=1 Tax=Nicotiana tomentosiformis TaxID=4098 RepID=UPI00051C7E83|nr:RHOMBOID-like protein 2 [Nicotiana tomentosiformis]
MGRRTPSSNSSPESDLDTIKVQPRDSGPNLKERDRYLAHYSNQHSRPPGPPPNYQPYTKWLPWLVPIIAIVNVVLFVLVMYVNDCPRNSQNCFGTEIFGRYAFQDVHENPLLGPSTTTLQKLGALDVKKVVEGRQLWRLLSCMWLHAGVFHVAANMLSLLFVGIRLEQEFGFVRIGPLYVLAGVGGSLLSALFVRKKISVGASGALFGLLGAMLSELITNWTLYENKLATLLTLLLIIAINLAVGILPHVDNFAHLGGFITGFLLGCVLLIRPQFGWMDKKRAPSGYFAASKKSKYKIYQYILLIMSLAIFLTGFILGLILLTNGWDGNAHCSWCHYLSCVPTPLWSCTEARCATTQLENQLNMTCTSNHKNGTYILSNPNNTIEIQMLCSKLCK